jgi:hypothetical protein
MLEGEAHLGASRVAGWLQDGSGHSESPPRPDPTRRRARGGVRGRGRLRRSSGSVGDGVVLALPEREWDAGLDPGLAEEGNSAKEKQREVADVDQRLRHLPLLRQCSSGSAARGSDGVRRCGSVVRGGGMEMQMRGRGEFQRGGGVL